MLAYEKRFAYTGIIAEDCSEFGNFVITLIHFEYFIKKCVALCATLSAFK